MADFRLREDTDDFFRHVGDKAPFKTKWDIYYLCALLGIFGHRSREPSEEGVPAPVFVQYVIDDYKGLELILIALLLLAEMAKVGYRVEDRGEVQQLLSQLIDPRAQSLGPDGVTLLNRYASGGFDLLLERYGDAAPNDPEEFLVRYARILHEVVEDAGHLAV